MFSSCTSLKFVDFSTLNTSKVISFYRLFEQCYNLTSFDISNFITDSASNFYGMFDCCFSLTSINILHFNFSNATTLKYMFNGCTKLKTIDISSMKTDNIIEFYDTFAFCHSLESIKMPKSIIKASDLSGLFSKCNSLTSVDLSCIDNSNVLNHRSMFSSCPNLTSIDISSFRIPTNAKPNLVFDIFSSGMANYGHIKINKEFYNRTNKELIDKWDINFI